MGLLKKIFKPVSKVLDKIIPNEIKPALPYLAAFAPYFGPTSNLLGQGIMRRAIMSGGLNIGAQLAQEGNEGDINLLSAGLGALSGAMTAPGAADTFAGSRIVGTGADGKAITASEYAKLSEGANLGSGTLEIAGTADPGIITRTLPVQGPLPFDQVVTGGSSGITGVAKAKNLALKGLEGGSKFISEGMAGGLKDKAQVLALPAATATAVGVPLAQGTGDAMYTDAVRLQKQQIIDDALAAAELLADSGARAEAIRNAMSAYDFFTEQEILDTIASAGYKAGGRVGFRFGGIDEAIESVQEETIEKGKEGIMQAAGEDPMLIEEYNKYVFDLLEQRPEAKPMSFQDFKRMIKSGMKDGGLMDLGGKEMDLRKGGFVPIGKKERADDVPARLSKNEFVMTADAVRAAGGGSVNKGAKRMYNLMNTLEARA